MMAAAQAAAEAALQEALASEGSQQPSYAYSDEALYSNPGMHSGADNMRLMESLHATDPGGQALLLQDLMGMPPKPQMSEDNSTNKLMQLLAQQEQHQQPRMSEDDSTNQLLQLLAQQEQHQQPQNSEDDSTNQLLQLLAQQEQHQQQQYAAAAEAVVMMRPEKHYITISQNGK
jgi:hypothetical protein